MTIRDLFDLGAPHAPATARDWGEAISDVVDTAVTSDDVTRIRRMTQAEFEALEETDPATLYIVIG